MRILGIDYGRKRIGLAISDETETLASPLPVHRRQRTLNHDLWTLKRLIASQGISRFVIGLPLNMDGSQGEMAEEALTFAAQLSQLTELPFDPVDERRTSAEAERVLIQGDVSRKKRRELRDGLAAVLILQSYLDRRQKESTDS